MDITTHNQQQSSGSLPAVAGNHQMLPFTGHTHRRSFEEDTIDLRAYWRIIWQRKVTVILFTILAMVVAFVTTAQKPKIYKSQLTMQIERSSNNMLNADGMTSMYDYWYSDDFYETQFELLKSNTLAERVSRDLNITSYEQITGKPQPSLWQQILESGSAEQDAVETIKPEETFVPMREPEVFAGALRGGLGVKPVKNSRLVTLSYDSTSPEMAAKIVNAYADSFMAMNLERRIADSSYAQTFLGEQIKQVRANLEESERVLVEYADQKKIADLDERLSVHQRKLDSLSDKLIEVEARRIEAQAAYEEETSTGIDSTENLAPGTLIFAYKQSIAQLESEYVEKSGIYKPAYPEMIELRAQIQGVKDKLNYEYSQLRQLKEVKFKAAQREESILKSRINEINQQVLDLRKRTTDYQALKRDVDSNLVLYDSLLQQTKEIGVAAGISANNISVVDYAKVPGSSYKPDMHKSLKMALLFGLLGGIGLAFLFDKLDDTVKSGGDLEEVTGLSVLGIVPQINKQETEGSIGMLTHKDPTSALAEAYRSFKTALSLSAAGGYPKVLQIASSGVGEGKTTTAIGVALSFIQAGAKVLLVDGDLRNPSIHKDMDINNKHGLTNFLAGNAKLGEVVERSPINSNLWVLTAGPISPNPAELLASDKMKKFLAKAEKQFDVVVVDGPPVLGLADALVLSNVTRGTVLVVDAGETRKGVLTDALKRLHGVQANIIGTILTKYNQGHSEYSYLYNYYGSSDKENSEDKRLAS